MRTRTLPLPNENSSENSYRRRSMMAGDTEVVGAPVGAARVPTGVWSGRAGSGVLLLLFLASGAAALIYQVLWARELGLLFGSTAQAAAITIAIFFAGLAMGGWWWGGRATTFRDPLVTFGWLELGVAATALGFLLLLQVLVAVEPALIALLGEGPVADTVIRAGVATVVLLPPSILMGGTLPLLGQHLVRERAALGRTGSLLYAVNTLGAALGALVAGFLLPVLVGYLGAYLVAVGLDAVVGIGALALAAASRRGRARDAVPTPSVAARAPGAAAATATGLPLWLIWSVALGSGVLTLAVEVVWTRLFAQVLQNSAYTYALVLATFLLALATGAGVASRLTRLRSVAPPVVLVVVLLASSAVAAVSPWLFHTRTEGLRLLGGTADFAGYVLEVAGLAVVVMFLPAVALGTLLPYLLRLLQQRAAAPGQSIGRLVAVNTVGGIVGSLAAGFVLLPWLGAWRSLLVVAAGYAALAAVVAAVLARAALLACATGRTQPLRPADGEVDRSAPARWVVVTAVAAVATVGLVLVTPGGWATVRLTPGSAQTLVEVREGPQATVSVVADRDDLFIRVDNHYTLGGTRALDAERNQSVVPLLTQEAPAAVFYLGMGTGITAGAGLAFDVERVVVCELIREVVELAEAHFTPWVNGLFVDERAVVRAADGRTCLRRSDETFDVIISDLFTPWEAGTGNLYTLEHFQTAQQRLAAGGAYVQWVPLYQVTDAELGVIGATMDTVFDEVTVWRGDLYAERSIVALVGRDDPRPLDPDVLPAQGRQLTDEPLSDAFLEALGLRMYVGNLTASGLYAGRELNTDRRPVIEYRAPVSQRAVRAGEATFVTGAAREAFYLAIEEAVPLSDDPFLARLDDRQLGYITAGRSYSRFRLLDRQGQAEEAQVWLDRFLAYSPAEASGPRDVSPAARLLPRLLPGPDQELSTAPG